MFPDRSPRIRHRNELTERDWENAVQGLGKSKTTTPSSQRMAFKDHVTKTRCPGDKHARAFAKKLCLMSDFTWDDVVSPRLKFLSSSWESKIASYFLTFPYPVPVPKIVWIFIGRNVEARASQAGLHKPIKDTASAKEGKVS